jgi:hypothetical protein
MQGTILDLVISLLNLLLLPSFFGIVAIQYFALGINAYIPFGQTASSIYLGINIIPILLGIVARVTGRFEIFLTPVEGDRPMTVIGLCMEACCGLWLCRDREAVPVQDDLEDIPPTPADVTLRGFRW